MEYFLIISFCFCFLLSLFFLSIEQIINTFIYYKIYFAFNYLSTTLEWAQGYLVLSNNFIGIYNKKYDKIRRFHFLTMFYSVNTSPPHQLKPFDLYRLNTFINSSILGKFWRMVCTWVSGGHISYHVLYDMWTPLTQMSTRL